MPKTPPNPVFWAMDAATRIGLGLADRVLLIYLAKRMKDGVCWPSQPLLAADCAMTERQVRRSRDELCKRGLIKFTPGDGREPSRYWLLASAAAQSGPTREDIKSAPGRTQSPPREDIKSAQGGLIPGLREDSESAEVLKKKSPKKNGTSSLSTLALPSTGFAEFYDRYPRKVARRRAEKAYAQALARGATEAEILAGLERHRFSPDPQFRPHPATWLNDSRWLDEPAAPALSPQDEIRQRWNLSSFMSPPASDGR